MAVRLFNLVWGGVCLTLAAGCTSWSEPAKSNKHPAGLNLSAHREKHIEAVSNYEQKRNDAQFQAALSRWRQGDAETAQDLLRKLLERQPTHLQARLLMSEIQLTEGSAAVALDHAQAAIKINAKDATANHQLGVALDANGKSAEAMAYYRKACELEPDNSLFRVDLQAAEDPTSMPKVVTASFETPDRNAKPATPATNSVTPVVKVAAKERSLPGTLADHVADMKAARLEGGRKPAVQHVGRSATAASDMTDGNTVAELQADMAAAPGEPQVAIAAAMTALRQGQCVLAAQLAQTGLREYPDCAGLYRVLGTTFLQLNEFARAETALRKAISLDNSNASTYFLLGCTLDKLGKDAAARTCYGQAQQLDSRYGQRAAQ